MDGRERIVRTLRFENPDRAPRDLWALPGISMFRKDELDALLQRFPSDLVGPEFKYGPGEQQQGTPYVIGSYVDEWGCVWHVGEPGVVGEVKEPPLADWSALTHFSPPYEILEQADLSQVNRSCAETDRFVLAWTTVRPFERMQFLRGSEALYIDLGYETAEMLRLREMVHEFFLRELEMWVKTDVDGIEFMDDWGAQRTLLISPKQWRSLFRPLYKDYCDLIHSAGKFAFFHSDGHITDIYPDLIEIGVDAVNSQLFCMDIEELGQRFRGQVTFWGEISRQDILPFGTPDDVRAAVRRVRAALDDGQGGVFAQCEWGIGVSAENVATVYETWLE
jgi:uroporphyrinogen decarboxylase